MSRQCFDFEKGTCTRGASCRFSHGDAPPGAGGGGGAPRGAQGACFAYQKGQCTRGDQCRFSHEGEGGCAPAGGGGGYGDRSCYNCGESGHISRECPTGGGGSGFGGGSRGVCFDFQKGACTRGDGCRFSHVAE